MRLYLSSYRLGNKPDELLKLVGKENKKVAIIANASDYKTSEERERGVKEQVADLSGIGLIPEEIDLRKYFGKQNELEEEISKYGLLWVKGGNALILQRAIEQSGFNFVVKNLLEKNKIVYAGYSAGISVIAPTLRGVELVDDPNIVPDGYRKDFSWTGMNLIKYNVAMHYKSNHPEAAAVEKEIEYLKENNIPYKTLKDGEVIVINEEKETIFTI